MPKSQSCQSDTSASYAQRLLNQVPSLLHAEQQNEAQFNYEWVLHFAERGLLTPSEIKLLVELRSSILSFHSCHNKIRLCERLLIVAKQTSLTTKQIVVNQQLIELYSQPHPWVKPPVLLFPAAPQSDIERNYIPPLSCLTDNRRLLSTSTTENEDSLHHQNTQAFNHLEVTSQFNWLTPLYIEQLKTYQEDDAEKITDLLHYIVQFAKRLQSQKLHAQAHYLYYETLLALNTKQKSCLNDIDERCLLEGICSLQENWLEQCDDKATEKKDSTRYFWSENLFALQEFRKEKEAILDKLITTIDHLRYNQEFIENVEALQKEITNTMKAFFAELFKQAESLLGEPPCDYCLIALGSIARSDATPFSDLESVLLVEKPYPENSLEKHYFECLWKLVAFQIATLGESNNPKGLHIDPGCHPGLPNLTHTPEGIVEKYGLQAITTSDEGIFASTLLNSILIYAHEKEDKAEPLWKKYHRLLTKQLIIQKTTAEPSMLVRHQKADEQLQSHLKNFNTKAIPDFNTDNLIATVLQEPCTHFFADPDKQPGCSVKRDFLAPFAYLLADLNFYHHLDKTNHADILKQLVENHNLELTFAQHCRAALAELNLFRLYQHTHNNQAQDLFPNNLPQHQQERLKHLWFGLIKPFYAAANQLTQTTEPIHPIFDTLIHLTNETTLIDEAKEEETLAPLLHYLLYTQSLHDPYSPFIDVYHRLPLAWRPFFLNRIEEVALWPIESQYQQKTLALLETQANPNSCQPQKDKEENIGEITLSNSFSPPLELGTEEDIIIDFRREFPFFGTLPLSLLSTPQLEELTKGLRQLLIEHHWTSETLPEPLKEQWKSKFDDWFITLNICLRTAAPYLIKLSKNNETRLQHIAIRALGKLGSYKPELIPKLLEPFLTALWNKKWERKSEQIRQDAAKTLKTIDSHYLHPGHPFGLGYKLSEPFSADNWRDKKSREVRTAAALALIALGKHKTTFTPQLLEHLLTALENQEDCVRKAAAQALKTLAKHNTALIPQLLKPLFKPLSRALGDRAECVREAVILAFVTLGSQDTTFIPQLLETLLTALQNEGIQRKASAQALVTLSSHNTALAIQLLPPFLTALQNPFYSVIEAPLQALISIATHNPTLTPQLLGPLLITSKNDYDCLVILKKLASTNPSLALEVSQLLLTVLDDSSSILREIATRTLGKLSTADPLLADQLCTPFLTALADNYDNVRKAAVHALGKLGTANPLLAPHLYEPLVAALGDESSEVKEAAAHALGKFTTTNPTLASELSELFLKKLSDNCFYTRQTAVYVIEQLGTVNPLLAPQLSDHLITALGDNHSNVRGAAAHTLGKFVSKNSTLASQLLSKPLLTALNDNDDNVREAAAYALEQLGTANPLLAPQLYKPLLAALRDDRNPAVREAAAYALGELVSRKTRLASELLSKPLLTALIDDVDNVRKTAAHALGKLGTANPLLAPQLCEPLLTALHYIHSYEVRKAAAKALVSLGLHNSNLAPQLLKTLLPTLENKRWMGGNAVNQAFEGLVSADPTFALNSIKTILNEIGKWFRPLIVEDEAIRGLNKIIKVLVGSTPLRAFEIAIKHHGFLKPPTTPTKTNEEQSSAASSANPGWK